MISTGACYAAGKDFCSVGHKTTKLCSILIVNRLDLIYTKSANFFSALFVQGRDNPILYGKK